MLPRFALLSALAIPAMSANLYTMTRGAKHGNNACGDSTFDTLDQGVPAPVHQCRPLTANWVNGMWLGAGGFDNTTTLAGVAHNFPYKNSPCWFGISPANPEDVGKHKWFYVGGQDVQDLMNVALQGLRDDDTVHAGGTMHCKIHDDTGVWEDAEYDIRWGIYSCQHPDDEGHC
ncbi:hypothetical protein F5B20DRAFT_546337 [Whalleya microplaca]|nr:hypothetical protein F5B20DRAFT_546337 [Whalleya microplaca]